MASRITRRTTSSDRPGLGGLAYDRAGRGSPLVLLHPLGADRRVWRPVLPLLEASRDVICVDLPGFGDSPPLGGGEPPTPARLAEAVSALLRTLGLDGAEVAVAGSSLGGWVALEMALAGHAASVTAIAPAGLWREVLGPKPLVGWTIARAARPLVGLLVRSRRLRFGALSGSVSHPERVPVADAAHLIRAYGGAADFVAVNAAMRSNRFDGLAEITVPVRLVWPTGDRLVSRPRTLPSDVEEIVLEDCGHIPMWDDPAAVAAALLA